MKSIKVAENLSAGGAALRDDRISARNRCDRSLRQRRYEEAEARRLGPRTIYNLTHTTALQNCGQRILAASRLFSLLSKEPAPTDTPSERRRRAALPVRPGCLGDS